MPRSLVVGLGNPLQGSDGFGAAVLERLGAERGLPPETELLDATTDLLACLDRFPAFNLIVLVDAVLGPSPREVIVVEEESFGSWGTHATSGHEMSPLVAVKLFRTLQPDSPTRIVLIGLRVDAASFARPATAHEAQAGAEAVRHVLQQD